MGLCRWFGGTLRALASAAGADEERPSIGAVLREHRAEVIARILLLLVTVTPIVLLSHDMATFLDDGLDRLGAPLALPVVLVIGLLTDQTVVLAESPANLLVLGVSLLLSLTTFSTKRVTALHGAARLFVFVLYGISVFSVQ